MTVPVAGNDCPNCGKKGTVFRCPRRNKGGHWDDGTEIICYICVNCTLSDVDGDGCSPGLGRQKYNDKEYWEATPEISWDLYTLITSLWNYKHRHDQIRQALGFQTLEEHHREKGTL